MMQSNVIDRSHALGEALAGVADGVFPDDREPVRVVAPPPGLRGAVVAFTGCTFVAADVDEAEVRARLGPNRLVGPVLPTFLAWLADAIQGTPLNHEVVLAALGTGETDGSLRSDPDWRSHDRATHGASLRTEVAGWRTSDGGIVLLGRGLLGRWEVAYETADGAPPRSGRALAAAARGLVPPGEPVFAQVAPGNARSLRATLAAGYVPIGGEVLIV